MLKEHILFFVLEMMMKICVSKINQSVCCPMEKTASIDAVLIVSIRHVTKSTAVVCMVVKRGNNVKQVYLTGFDMFSKYIHFCNKEQQFIKYTVFIILAVLNELFFQSVSSKAKNQPQTVSSLDNLPVIGATFGTFIVVIIGIIISVFVIR